MLLLKLLLKLFLKVIPQVTPQVTPQIDNTKSEIKTEEVNSVIPSKYFIPKNNLRSNDAGCLYNCS